MFGYADSGINFDHIYKNHPSGYRWPGTFIDRLLLGLPACKATRNRKIQLMAILKKEIKENLSERKTTKIVDLASGPSRYLFELMDETKAGVEALCLDTDWRSINYGRSLAKGKPIMYRRINVFRVNKLQKLIETTGWRPNIVLVSGLYEYHPDSAVKKSLYDIEHSLELGGLILFFCQADNPSKKLMKKLGRTKGGTPWTLFYRKPNELQAWMAEAGFTDINISVDRWGMYLTCCGRKSR